MNSFVDIRKISSYSLALAEKLINEKFSAKTVISGTEIKQFTPVQQINLIIFRNLFEKWQEETSRLKSPYFDYEHTEVQNALQVFLNTLSNHIAVSKEFLKPLLTKAIEDTLYLAMAPAEFLKQEILYRKDEFRGTIEKNKKFLRINTGFLTALDKHVSEFPLASWQELADYVSSLNLSPDETDILSRLNELLKIELDDILIHPKIESAQTVDQGSEVRSTISLHEEGTMQYHEKNQDSQAAASNSTTHFPSLNERFIKEETMLNDRLKTADDAVYSPLVKIDDLRSVIGLGEKFVYIKELFNDDVSAYAVTLSEIEKMDNLENAMKFLNEQCWAKYNWNISNIHLQEFISLVERRFGTYNHQTNRSEI